MPLVSFATIAATFFIAAAGSAAPLHAAAPPAFVAAAAADKPDKAPRAAPDDANPLADDDLFVGEFSSEEMLIVIRVSVDGYVGEIRRRGQTFPMKGKVEAGGISGTFAHDQSSYPFTAGFDGAVLKVTTGKKVYALQRKPAGGAVTPPVTAPPAPLPPAPPVAVPPPSVPAKPPEVVTPSPNPATNPAPGPSPTPGPTPAPTPGPPEQALPASPVGKAAPLPDDRKASAGKTWSGFPAGTFVVIEQESLLPGKIVPLIQRSAFVFQGMLQGSEMVVVKQFTNLKWETDGRPMPWMTQAQSLTELGYIGGQAQQETLTVDGRPLPCSVVEYSIDERKGGALRPRRLKVWTAGGLSLPPQPFPLPRGFARFDGGVVRVVSLDDEKDAYHLEYQLESLRHKFKIGQREIEAALFKGREVVATSTGPDETRHERIVSIQIPGGVARSVTERRRGSQTVSTLSATTVEMGMSKP